MLAMPVMVKALSVLFQGGKASSRSSLSGAESIEAALPRPHSATGIMQDSSSLLSPRQLVESQDKQQVSVSNTTQAVRSSDIRHKPGRV